MLNLWYLSVEIFPPLVPIPGALQPTGQLAYSMGPQYPSPQQLCSGDLQRYQTLVSSQLPHQGSGLCTYM